MGRFFPKRKLSFSEVILIPETYLYLLMFRIKVSYQSSGKWMPKASKGSLEKIDSKKLKKALLVVGIITGLENRTPWENTCLVKALAAHRMLKKRRINHEVHIGVASKLNDQLEAHAWLTVDNEIILGGENADGFHEISRIQYHIQEYI